VEAQFAEKPDGEGQIMFRFAAIAFLQVRKQLAQVISHIIRISRPRCSGGEGGESHPVTVIADQYCEESRPVRKITRMKLLRKMLGHSQSQVEKFTHINHTLYSMLENGRVARPYPWMARRLESYYGTTMDRLLEFVPVDKYDQWVAEQRKRFEAISRAAT
jgi:DNA-binding XRE family transcriptional regulator